MQAWRQGHFFFFFYEKKKMFAEDAQLVFFNGNLIHAKMMTWFSSSFSDDFSICTQVCPFVNLLMKSRDFFLSFWQCYASLKATVWWNFTPLMAEMRYAGCKLPPLLLYTKEICFDKGKYCYRGNVSPAEYVFVMAMQENIIILQQQLNHILQL